MLTPRVSTAPPPTRIPGPHRSPRHPVRHPAGERRQTAEPAPDRGGDVTNSLAADHPATYADNHPTGAVTEPAALPGRGSLNRARAEQERAVPRRHPDPRIRHRPRRRVHRPSKQRCRNILLDRVAANRAASELSPDTGPETRPITGGGDTTAVPAERSRAGPPGSPAPPVADARARGANQAGRTQRQQWLGASEQPPRRGPQARSAEHRSGHRPRRIGHPAGVVVRSEREGRPRPPERALAAIRTLAQRGRRGASRGGRPGSAGQTKGVVSEANGTRSASRLLMPFLIRAIANGSERQRGEFA